MGFVQLLPLAQAVAQQLHKDWDERLTVILRYCAQSPQQKAFPVIAKIGLEQNPEHYLTRYLQRYYLAREQTLALRDVTTVPDPAVDVILQAFGQLDDFSRVSLHHRQSMAAENLLGELLERYIAERLEAYGWVWCAGNTVRAVDFLREDLSVALQIKNRDNSENSSSSAIRQGTDIRKWFRIYSRSGRTNWENFL